MADSWEWGWDAVSALGQAFGAVGTVAAFWATYRMLKVERRRDKAERDNRVQAQAEQFAVWPSVVLTDPSDPDSAPTWGVAIRNAGNLPVYQVQVERRFLESLGMEVVAHELVPPGDWLLSGATLYPKPESSSLRAPIGVMPPRTFAVGVWFTDAAGARWFRNEDGLLSLVADV